MSSSTAFYVPSFPNIQSSLDGVPSSFSPNRLPSCPNFEVVKINTISNGSGNYSQGQRIEFTITGGPGMGLYRNCSGFLTGSLNMTVPANITLTTVLASTAGDGTLQTGAVQVPQQTITAGSAICAGSSLRVFVAADRANHSVNDFRRDQELKFGGQSVYNQIDHSAACAMHSICTPESSEYKSLTANWRDMDVNPREGFDILASNTELADYTFGEILRYTADTTSSGQSITSAPTACVLAAGVYKIPFFMFTECPLLDNKEHAIPLFMLPDGQFSITLTNDLNPLILLTTSDPPAIGNNALPQGPDAQLQVWKIPLTQGAYKWNITDLQFHYERLNPGLEFENQYRMTLMQSESVHQIPFVRFQTQINPAPAPGAAITQNTQFQTMTGSLNGVAFGILTVPNSDLMRGLISTFWSYNGINDFNVQIDGKNIFQNNLTTDQQKRFALERTRYVDTRDANQRYSTWGWNTRRQSAGIFATTTLKVGEQDMINRGITVSRTIQLNVSWRGQAVGGSYTAPVTSANFVGMFNVLTCAVIDGSLSRDVSDQMIKPCTHFNAYANGNLLTTPLTGATLLAGLNRFLYCMMQMSATMIITPMNTFNVTG